MEHYEKARKNLKLLTQSHQMVLVLMRGTELEIAIVMKLANADVLVQ